MLKEGYETALSAVVGEMLMIAIVLILVAVFSSSISDYLPSERSPTVEIKVCHDTRTISLWHKGGDWVKTDSLRVVVSNNIPNNPLVETYRLNGPGRQFSLGKQTSTQSTQTFDLGDTITVTWDQDLTDEKVTLATDKAVVYSGNIGGDCP